MVESLKVVTRDACERIARFAFATLRAEGRKHLAFVHKANIMKMSDGLFLATVRRIAKENPDVGYRELIVDAACMQLVLDPYPFDVLLMGNHYGDILTNLGSGLPGGISGAHAINIGDRHRVYEAIHGDAPHLVGTGRANPLPLLSPAIALMRHVGENTAAERIAAAMTRVLEERRAVTADLGGSATTSEMAAAIVAAMPASVRPWAATSRPLRKALCQRPARSLCVPLRTDRSGPLREGLAQRAHERLEEPVGQTPR